MTKNECKWEDAIGIQEAMKIILERIPGENSKRQGLERTPYRVAKMYEEIFAGYQEDPEEYLKRVFSDEDEIESGLRFDDIVLVDNIDFFSTCEHHMVPFHGVVHVAYIPKGKVVGLSKIVRVVNAYAHRLQVQERLEKQILNCIDKSIGNKGVAVMISAQHMCMKMRGVKNSTSYTTTCTVTGAFRTEPELELKFMKMIELSEASK